MREAGLSLRKGDDDMSVYFALTLGYSHRGQEGEKELDDENDPQISHRIGCEVDQKGAE